MSRQSLAEFLLARIAEDEERARLAAEVDGAADMLAALPTPLFDGMRVAFPSRVLAECKAKRVAVDWYLNDDDTVMSATIKALAAVYADHPDYLEEWAL